MTNQTNTNHAAAMAGVHDSQTCSLGADGGRCELCELAHESEVHSRILEGIRQDGQVASVTVIRAALVDVLDAGQPCIIEKLKNQRCRHAWEFNFDESEEQTAERERFVDAVCARIVQLQSPPHAMDKRLRALVELARKELNRRPKR